MQICAIRFQKKIEINQIKEKKVLGKLNNNSAEIK